MSHYATEEEQLEAIKKFWQKHQKLISSALLVVILIGSGFRYWLWHTQKMQVQASQAYEQMMVAFSKQDKPALSAYMKQLKQDYTGTVYADVAHLLAAHEAVAENKLEEAILELKTVAEHSKMPMLTEVAKMRLARIYVYQQDLTSANQILSAIKQPVYQSSVAAFKETIGS